MSNDWVSNQLEGFKLPSAEPVPLATLMAIARRKSAPTGAGYQQNRQNLGPLSPLSSSSIAKTDHLRNATRSAFLVFGFLAVERYRIVSTLSANAAATELAVDYISRPERPSNSTAIRYGMRYFDRGNWCPVENADIKKIGTQPARLKCIPTLKHWRQGLIPKRNACMGTRAHLTLHWSCKNNAGLVGPSLKTSFDARDKLRCDDLVSAVKQSLTNSWQARM